MPYIILRGKSNEIGKAVTEARAQSIECVSFLETMTGGSYVEQMEKTAQTTAENLKFYAAVLYGPWETVSAITKKFSLYK